MESNSQTFVDLELNVIGTGAKVSNNELEFTISMDV